MDTVLVFDVRQQWDLDWHSSAVATAVGLFALGIALALGRSQDGRLGTWLLRWNSEAKLRTQYRLACIMVPISLIFILISTGRDAQAVATTRYRLHRGEYQVVAGTIVAVEEDSMRQGERWFVSTGDSTREYYFEYSSSAAGYRLPRTRGGPDVRGALVEIFDVGGRMARVEALLPRDGSRRPNHR